MPDLEDASAEDMPFEGDQDEPTDVPVSDPDAVAKQDEDQTDTGPADPEAGRP